LIYLDTSAIVPYYVPEKLSDVVEQLLQKQEDQPIISQLVEVEFFSALSRRVRMGEVSQNDARRITELFTNHLNEGLYRLVLLENQHYSLARDWISRLYFLPHPNPHATCFKSGNPPNAVAPLIKGREPDFLFPPFIRGD
jgi:predicted nucleic acid-binding protein